MKTWLKVLIGIILLIVVAGVYFTSQFHPASEISWGLTFSQHRADELGFDPMIMYKDILADLHPQKIRLIAYWDQIEPSQDKYDFAQLDQMLKLANDNHVQVILAIGKKEPRWPECHQPDWVNSLNDTDQSQVQLDMIKTVVNHFKNTPAIKIWQVENEPLFHFGDKCGWIGHSFLKQEVGLVKSLDTRPVLVTDSGELGLWLPAATVGEDLFGSTMYRVVYHRFFGYIKYPLPPQFFHLKAGILKVFTKLPPPVGVELQAEPWVANGILNTDLDTQRALMNPKVLASNIAYAKQAGFEDNYLWGVEWWYWMAKKQNDWGMWTYAKQLFAGKN